MNPTCHGSSVRGDTHTHKTRLYLACIYLYMYEDIHTLIHTHTHHVHLYVYTYALPTFLRSLPIAAARECGNSKSSATGFSIEHRLLDYSTITTCRGRERGRVLAYVRATTVTLGQAEVHAQQQASATHRKQPAHEGEYLPAG